MQIMTEKGLSGCWNHMQSRFFRRFFFVTTTTYILVRCFLDWKICFQFDQIILQYIESSISCWDVIVNTFCSVCTISLNQKHPIFVRINLLLFHLIWSSSLYLSHSMNKKKFTTGRMKKLPKVQRKKKGYVQRRHCTELFLKGR